MAVTLRISHDQVKKVIVERAILKGNNLVIAS